ncbi:DUF2524 family protein [Alteribacter natronophilus]|uniref:DUF2524 family protein n=1 Tax=Alteribacter natronophilus TaxID=2583810 RepID=UPI00110D8677|nr:DUF2524 family protein [Alteribacter natronophilus]TMW73548.1 DUF2524 family protein [Alteribacter natronophilus]
MANYDQMEQFITGVREVMEEAQAQLDNMKRVNPSDPADFQAAQQHLEEVHLELEKLINSANPEQRDQLLRVEQQIHQLQNRMILGL